MKVSIITVTYNSEKYLEDCIQSVIKQEYPNIEYLIIDGKSTDETLNIIQKHSGFITKFISENDNGMYDAINKGMQMATGDIIGVLHSDDVFAGNGVVSAVVEAFKANKVDAVYGDLNYVYAEDISKIYRNWKGKIFHRRLFHKGWMPAHPAFYFKKELLEKYGNYKIEFKSAADYELMARYLYKHRVPAIYIPELMILMRRGGMSNSNIKKRIQANRNDYLAMKTNGIPMPLLVSIVKPLSKLPQYFKK